MDALALLKHSIDEGRPVALCTIVNTKGAVPRHAGTKMLLFDDGRVHGTVGGGEVEQLVLDEARTALKDGKTRFLTYDLIDVEKGDPGVCGGTLSVFVEPFLREATVVVVGAGHVGKAVAHLASWLDFRVVLSDDRVELCTPEVVPDADQYLPIAMQEIPKEIDISANTYLVLVTRSVDVDVGGLPALLATPAPYIGLIGSKRRWQHTQEKLKEIGVAEDIIQRIKSPIGLSIEAETPREIAVSIMAEVVAHYNQGKRHYRKG